MDYDELEADRQVSINITDRLARVRGKELGIILPENTMIVDIVDENYGMMLVDSDDRYVFTDTNRVIFKSDPTAEYFHSWLCSPLGYIEVPAWYTTVWQAAKALGIKIPHRKDKRTWENIEPYWVAVALSKL